MAKRYGIAPLRPVDERMAQRCVLLVVVVVEVGGGSAEAIVGRDHSSESSRNLNSHSCGEIKVNLYYSSYDTQKNRMCIPNLTRVIVGSPYQSLALEQA